MKLYSLTSALMCSSVTAFVVRNPTSSISHSFSRTHVAVSDEAATSSGSESKNVLEGREIGEFTPVNNMIFVKKVDVVDQTEGGIFLTGKDKISRSEGEVISTGSGKIDQESGFQFPMVMGIGEGVIFGKFDGQEVTYNGEKHTILRDDDILVKFPSGADWTIDNAEVTNDNVLVKVEKVDDGESTSGILIAKTSTKKKGSSIGEVLKVGPGRYACNGVLMDMDTTIGDMVKYRDFAAQEVTISGEDYAVVRFTDLLAKF